MLICGYVDTKNVHSINLTDFIQRYWQISEVRCNNLNVVIRNLATGHFFRPNRKLKSISRASRRNFIKLLFCFPNFYENENCYILPRNSSLCLNGFEYPECTHYHIYHPLRSGRIWHKVNFFKRSLTGLNSEFSFSETSCLTKAKEPSLPYYLPIAGGRIIGFIPFPRVLVLCEMQSVSSRIWTCVAMSISYDDNHYTTGTSKKWVYPLQKGI